MDIWGDRNRRNNMAKSKAYNFGKILNFSKLNDSTEPLKEREARNLISKLRKVENPRRGDLAVFEEMECFLGDKMLFYMGILTDPQKMTILSQENGVLTIENKEVLNNRYVQPYLKKEIMGYKLNFYRK